MGQPGVHSSLACTAQSRACSPPHQRTCSMVPKHKVLLDARVGAAWGKWKWVSGGQSRAHITTNVRAGSRVQAARCICACCTLRRPSSLDPLTPTWHPLTCRSRCAGRGGSTSSLRMKCWRSWPLGRPPRCSSLQGPPPRLQAEDGGRGGRGAWQHELVASRARCRRLAAARGWHARACRAPARPAPRRCQLVRFSPMPSGSWPSTSPFFMPGSCPRYRWRSEPHKPLAMMRTMASCSGVERVMDDGLKTGEAETRAGPSMDAEQV